MHSGVRVTAGGYHGNWMSDLIAQLRGVHEPQEEKVFHELLQHIPDDGVIVEVGCFWAYYSLWFLQGHPHRRAHLIEPVLEKLDVGRANFELNGARGDFLHGFIVDPEAPDDGFVDWDGRVDGSLEGVILDAYLAERGLTHVDVLHADIQGAEFSLLRGADRSLRAGVIDFVLLSTHGEEHHKCLGHLKDLGFSIIAEHTIQESYSADGLIVAQAAHMPPFPPVTISRRAPI